MISENNKVITQQIIESCLKLNEYIKQLQKTFTFDELDKSAYEKQYIELLGKIAEINYTNYSKLKAINNHKEKYKLTDEVMAYHDKSSHGEQIMVNCLEVDASLKTIYKALYYDENEVEGFCNDYLYILEKAIETNWKTHVVGEEVSIEEFKRIFSTITNRN